ncbi:MAG: RDD family protein [Xanthomonadales bacterium]|nr:RDD family protein [Xanthomonadales bacterium]MBK7144203.1 RDD family protein [Xanthomonadales bacterium]
MATWYYGDAQRNRHGPLSPTELAALHARGELQPDTPVWREGLDGWKPWREVMGEVVGAGAPPVPPTPGEPVSPYAPPRAQLHDEGAVVAGGHVVYAGFWKRFAAVILDSFVTGFLTWMLMIPVFLVLGAGFGDFAQLGTGSNVLLTLLYYLFAMGVPLVYMSWMHSSSNQATLGKMAVGIKVTRVDGTRISFLRAFGRYFGYMLSSLLLCIGLIMAAFTERKQALHDLMCDTLVVDKHAFTATPELQQEGLGAVAIIVLVLTGLMFLGMIVLIGIAIAALSSGGWH